MKLSQRWASAAREALVPADTDARDRFAFVLLLAFIVFVPWLGSARLPAATGVPAPIGRLLVPALACAIGALTFSSRSSFRSPRSLGLFLASMLGLALLGLVQLLPLPEPALEHFASVNLQIYHETAELLSLYEQTSPSARVSLTPEGTAAIVLLLGGFVVLVLAAVHLLRTRPRRRAFAAAAVAGACLQIAAGAPGAAAGDAFRGAFASESDLGDFLLVLLPVSFGVFWSEILTNADRGRETADRGERLAVRLSPLVARFLVCVIVAIGVVLTGSPVRIGAAALTMVILFALAARHPLRVRRTVVAAAAMLGGAAVFVENAAGQAQAQAQAQALGPFSPFFDRTLAVWQTSLDAWKSFPILGAGLGAFPDAFRRVQPRELTGLVEDARSDLLQLLVTGGAVGAFFAVVGFLSILVLLFRRWRAQRHREESAFSLAGIGALLIVGLDGLGEFNLGVPAVSAALACVIGFAMAAGDGSPREQSWTPPTTAV